MAERAGTRDSAGMAGCVIVIVIGVAALATSGDFSPLGSVFPRTIAGLAILLSLLYLVLEWRGRARPATAAASAPAAAQEASKPRQFGVAVVMLAWAFLLVPLGFLFTSVCASVALLLLAQHGRWSARTAFGYGCSTLLVLAALYALFRFALQVPLPVGVFL